MDVAFLHSGRLVGIGEVATLGLAHYGISSQELRLLREFKYNEVTTHDKLLHIDGTQEEVKFLILVTGPWKVRSQEKMFIGKRLGEWFKHWKNLSDILAAMKSSYTVFVHDLANIELCSKIKTTHS